MLGLLALQREQNERLTMQLEDELSLKYEEFLHKKRYEKIHAKLPLLSRH